MTNDPQYERAASGFDQVAAVYDSVYGAEGQNTAVRWMKTENWNIVAAALETCERVLELGCGTGEDAVTLARSGKFVLATDISPVMVERTVARADGAGLSGRLQTRVAAAGKLGAILDEFGRESFDGVYSAFTLIYETDMPAVNRGAAALLRPGGTLVASIYSRSCLWEIGWWFLHGHPIGAFRRWRKWTKSQIGAGQKLPTQHYTPAQFARHFQPDFVLRRAAALSLILPAPFLDPLYQKHRTFFDRLIPLERRVREWPLLNGWGNAFVAVFQRR